MSMTLLYALVIVGVVALGFLAAFVDRRLWLHRVRLSLFGFIARSEAVTASATALRSIVTALSMSSDERLWQFASNREDEDRHALQEVATRMHALASDLRHAKPPKPLWWLCVQVQKTADIVADEAAKTIYEWDPNAVLARLSEVDLVRVAEAVTEMGSQLKVLLRDFGVDDSALYGGGLYI